MQYKKTILIVEDERAMARLLRTILKAGDYKPLCAFTGEEGLRMCRSYNPDLVLLDLGLPDMDGMAVLRNVRARQAPVIVISARQDEMDKVEALNSGAADYVTKPFGNAELLVRIRNILLLYDRLKPSARPEDSVFSAGDFSVDFAAYRVTVRGQPVHLTPIEYKIVELLARNAGAVMTHEQIIDRIWGHNNCEIQVLRVNMANIRRKIEENPADPKIITTELGVGYRLG